MKKLSLCFLLMSFSSVSFAAPNSEIAELALHRVERLIALKKIPVSYAANFESLELAPPATENGLFTSTISQFAAENGDVSSVQISSDSTGRAVNFILSLKAVATSAPTWPSKDSLEIAELSMHHIEHLSAQDPAVEIYISSFHSLELMQHESEGVKLAHITISAFSTEAKLTLLLNADGTLKSYEIN